MRLFHFISTIMMVALAACSGPQAENPLPTPLPAQTETPATATSLPPTEPAATEGKLPAAPFDAQLYINQEAGFALDYPIGWTVNEMVVGPRGTQIQFLSDPALAEASAIPAGETRLSATIYQWDPKNDLSAYVQHQKDAWNASGFSILDEQPLTLEQGLPAVLFTIQAPDSQVVILVTALKDRYLVVSGEGDLDQARQIVERVRPVS